MIATPVSVRGRHAVRDTLLSHGWEGDVASLTSGGLEWAAFHVEPVEPEALEAMVRLTGKLGLDLVTGDNWLLLAGPRARLGAFARPWVQPEAVQQLAMTVGMAMNDQLPTSWQTAGGQVDCAAPVMMGIVNITPDSFSVASRADGVKSALAMVDRMLAEGATVIDVGGESTRPGATPIDPAEERRRVIPGIAAIRAAHPALPISIDTVHADTALAAMEAGATIINDVTAGRHDPELLNVAADSHAGLILSHSRGVLGSLTGLELADYGGDVVGAVVRELSVSLQRASAAGVAPEQIVLDPGFGFAKTADQNWRLLDGLDALVSLGRPVLVGVSRKRFLGKATGREEADRDPATAAAVAIACDRGARFFRVHSPGSVVDALAVAAAVHR